MTSLIVRNVFIMRIMAIVYPQWKNGNPFQKKKKKKKDKRKKEKRKSGYIEADGITTPSKEQVPPSQSATPAAYKLPVSHWSLNDIMNYMIFNANWVPLTRVGNTSV